jgi:pimeloyl-ACP methyl ester carboxylesterase
MRARFWIASLLLAALTGCSLVHPGTKWYSPVDAPPVSDGAGYLTPAEASFAAGSAAEAVGNPAAIDYYYAAALGTWPTHVANAAALPMSVRDGATATDAGAELYRGAVRKLVGAAVRFGRFDPARGVTLASGQFVPIRYFGFLWQPSDFAALRPVGAYDSPELPHGYVSGGVGVDYVVLASNALARPFIKNGQPFAATVVLQPSDGAASGVTLDFYDPLRTTSTERGLPLARDLTAPIAYAATQDGDSWLRGFIDPAVNRASATLRMEEPFQPGKMPIVLVHGLASSPVTWSHIENDLRAQPAIMARYQIWTFRYDTGDPFLTSAAELRRQLAALRQAYDPFRVDPSESRTVMIGHSLGGLVSKLQVTYSSDQLWLSAAKRPFETIATDADTRARLASSFFFEPSQDIDCVIYIATPHRGSVYARRCIGLISSSLIEEPPDWTGRHAQLVRDNPDAFDEELERGVPNSVDLLEPSSRILEQTTRLPYRQGVVLHAIIGDDRWTLSEGANDGVVAVSSAHLDGVQSEVVVDASHTEILKQSETSNEVLRILLQHAAAGP